MNICRRTILALVFASNSVLAEPLLKTERFDRDPGWDAHHNHVELKKVPIVKQDFGESATSFAGGAKLEIGGRVQRSTRPATYALPIVPKTLDQKFSASGTFAITQSQPSGGVFFGFFQAEQPGGSGRPIGSLGLNMDFEGKGGRLAVRLITATNQSCGTFITPYLPGKYRTTPLKADGTRYAWTLDYDPAGASGRGRFSFTLNSDTHPLPVIDPKLPDAWQREERARFPATTVFHVDLPPGYRQQGASFDRFGLMNMMKAGGAAQLYFAELKIDGNAIDLSSSAGWIGKGNRDTYEDREQTGAHHFGFSAATSHAGGQPGEVGGDFWRSGEYGYVGDRVGPLDLHHRLEARGRVTMVVGGPDADMMFGWFSSERKDASPIEAGNFLGIAVGGPTRVGHYFAPSLTNAKGRRAKVDAAPILRPGRSYEWSLIYDPTANGGDGEIRVTLGGESVTLPVKAGVKSEGAHFDRFGMFTSQAGGQLVRIFLDDLTYTAGERCTCSRYVSRDGGFLLGSCAAFVFGTKDKGLSNADGAAGSTICACSPAGAGSGCVR